MKANVILQGPSGRLTVVHLTIRSYDVQDRVHFGGSGWKTFVLENGLKVGDHLIFSLVTKSTFMVRLLSEAPNDNNTRKVRCTKAPSEFRHSGPEPSVSNTFMGKSSESFVTPCEERSRLCSRYREDEA